MVQSQADTEQAELARERTELHADAQGEQEELMAIYVGRGLDRALAHQVAEQLMAHDALGAHARDELGITETLSARPLQAGVGIGLQLRGARRPAAAGHRPRPGGTPSPSSRALPWPASRSWVGSRRAWVGRR